MSKLYLGKPESEKNAWWHGELLADRAIAIYIPTLGRDDKLPDLVENIHKTTNNDAWYHIYFICEKGHDAAKKLEGKHVTVFTGDFGSPAKAVNYAFTKTSEPYFIFANDDFKFHQNWAFNALSKMTDGISVVAINDGDPRQTTQWGTITLVKRSYIDDPGGTENKGEVFHEGYKHNFVDTEFWQRAAARRVVEIAKDSLIEHLHPAFGKGDADGGYQKSGDTMAQDSELFAQRKTWLA